MKRCESCDEPLEQRVVRGRPRRWCQDCLPSVNVIGRREYRRRYALLSTGRSRSIRVAGSDGLCPCGRGVSVDGLCATHFQRRRTNGDPGFNVPIPPEKTKADVEAEAASAVRAYRKMYGRWWEPIVTNPIYRTTAWRNASKACLARDGRRCMIRMPKCKGAATTADHIIELQDGGPPFDLSNLQAACRSCNTAKRNRRVAAKASGAGRRLQDW